MMIHVMIHNAVVLAKTRQETLAEFVLVLIFYLSLSCRSCLLADTVDYVEWY
jgi:hypothetical protein